jgi:hypothetical protein
MNAVQMQTMLFRAVGFVFFLVAAADSLSLIVFRGTRESTSAFGNLLFRSSWESVAVNLGIGVLAWLLAPALARMFVKPATKAP